MAHGLHICDFRSEPGETECHEACWSQGRSCRGCEHHCYRAGWDKARVDLDNIALVARKQGRAT